MCVLLILFALLVESQAQVMSLGMHCQDLTGKLECLNRAPTHHMEVEGDVNSVAHWPYRPLRIPIAPRELLWLLDFSIQSFSCLLYKKWTCMEATSESALCAR